MASDPVIGEDVRPSVYISLINAYKKMENAEMYEATLTEARGQYPENKDLLDIQLQSFLDKKDSLPMYCQELWNTATVWATKAHWVRAMYNG